MKKKTNKPRDIELWQKIATVVRNYVEYDSYNKDKRKALKVIIKKFPKENITQCESMFDEYVKIINESNENVLKYFKVNPNKTSKYSEYQDIDFEKFSNDLKSKYPKTDIKAIKGLVNWSIFWHYLK